MLEAHGGAGVTYSERRHRFAPGNQENENTLAADNVSSFIVLDVGMYPYDADLLFNCLRTIYGITLYEEIL